MCGLAFLLVLPAFCQDPFVVAADHYKLELDNEWVQIARVSYRPHDTAPVHDHPRRPAIYIYVVDGGPIAFAHDKIGKITRPAVKAGGVRYARPNIEKHEVEYLGNIPTEYLRVELKTEDPDPLVRDIRLAPELHSGTESVYKPEFENSQIRLIRIYCGGGQTCTSASLPDFPAILVNLDDRQVKWIAPLTPAAALPRGDYIRIELKTKPSIF